MNLRMRLSLTVFSLILCTILALGFLSYWQIRSVIRQTARDRLEAIVDSAESDLQSELVDQSDPAELDAPLRIFLYRYLLLSALLVLLAVFVTMLIARSIAIPLKKLERGTEIIEKGDFDFRVEAKGKDEIGKLACAFNAMTQGLQKATSDIEGQVLAQTQELRQKKYELEEQQRAILNILEDVEEEKNKVKKEKIRTDSLLASIGDGIIATDQDGRIVLVNKFALEMLGYSEEEMGGKSVIEKMRMIDERGNPIPLTQRPMVLALSTGKKAVVPFGQTYYYLRKDDSRFPAGITVTPFIWEGKIIGTIQVFRDITLEKDVDRAKTEFVSLASHQLRTPLSAIKWFSEMLLAGDVGKLNKKQREYLQEIYDGNQRMIDLVNALLNVSRIELGTFAVEPEPTQLPALVEIVLKEEFLNIKRKGLKVSVEYDPALPAMNVDPKLMRIVLQNLISNAIKYTPAKGRVLITITKQSPDIIVQVKDSGYGIPKAAQPQIFTKMYRADNVKEKDTTGTGLGLYIVKAIIETSKGKIWFVSQENKGTTFYVALPLAGMPAKAGTRALTE